MTWKKVGQLFCSNGQSELMYSHAQNPQAIHLSGNIFRIFFSSRDIKNRSSIFYGDLDIDHIDKPLRVQNKPILSFGSPGFFDDSGVTLGHLVEHNKRFYLYYLGWNLGVTVPWRNSIGLAIATSLDGTFTKFEPVPVLDRNKHDPFSLSYPFVIPGKDSWSMLYGSNLAWGESKDDMYHVLKDAYSQDGLTWKPTGKIQLEIDGENEIAVSRPWIATINGQKKLFFSYRKDFYRIGSADLVDGQWKRTCNDEIMPTVGAWDGEMVCYPSIFSHNEQHYLLYCGNGYGKTGFGLAVWQK